MSRYVLFLGAGASHAEGLPLQRDLLTQHFARELGAADRWSRARNFFQLVFGIDVVANPQAGQSLPTFEDTLGLIDLATSRGESLRGIPLPAHDDEGLDLPSIRRELVLLMAEEIRQSVPAEPRMHVQLVRNLRDGGRLAAISFITTNYDTLLDNALYDEALPEVERGSGAVVDYGFSSLVPRSAIPEHDNHTYPLHKVHGSLNWLHCPVCMDLVVTQGVDIVARLLDDPQTAACTHCDTMREPVIVPPTLYKSLSNVYLAVVWNRAARSLRDARHLVFCGYSLADADMHVKYLVKAAQLNRGASSDPLRITLVNNYPDKPESIRSQELRRYSGLFGTQAVTDSGMSFEEFASDPAAILGRPRG